MGGWEGVREIWREHVREGERGEGSEGATGGREDAMMICDDDMQGESFSGGREGQGREGC